MYADIASNKRNSAILIGLFIGLLAAVGYVYGYVTGAGYDGLIFAMAISIVMTLVSWFAGDSIALSMAGAQQITERAQNTYVWNLVENLCITAGLPMPRIFLIDDPAPNAFATGRDPEHASIALTTGLVQIMENEELEGVIAHELSHVKNLDIRWMMLVAVLVGCLSLLADWMFRGSLFRRRDSNEGGGLGLVLGIAVIILAPIIGQLIKFAISRRREYLADASGALLTRYPEGLARALEKIRDAGQAVERAPNATAHLWIAEPHGHQGFSEKLAGLFSTHPPIDDRVQKLRTMGH
ncbi:MAG: M48 family metalloprotease [Patescibacteria group bacterium]